MAIADPVPRQAARELAATYPRRSSTPHAPKAKTARGRLEATPERVRRGDIVERGGQRVAIPQLERMRGRQQLDHNARMNEALFAAGDRLRRHQEGIAANLKAFDPTRTAAASDRSYDPSEARLRHAEHYTRALALLGGTASVRARVVLAIVVDDWTVEQTAKAFIGPGKAERIKATTRDTLRSGLFALAVHWRFI